MFPGHAPEIADPSDGSVRGGGVLLCFAMRMEAAPVKRAVAGRQRIRVLTVGIGPRNAETAIRRALEDSRPDLVLTCGLAGGLCADLVAGDILFETVDPDLARQFHGLGIRAGKLHCSSRVASFAADKARLRASTGADAVEMESGAIQAVCLAQGVPCATLRIISDVATEDLPIDFNAFTDEGGGLDGRKLAWAMLQSPWKLPALVRLQSSSSRLSRRLSAFLVDKLLPGLPEVDRARSRVP